MRPRSAGPDLQGQLVQLFLFVYFMGMLRVLSCRGSSSHFTPVESSDA